MMPATEMGWFRRLLSLFLVAGLAAAAAGDTAKSLATISVARTQALYARQITMDFLLAASEEAGSDEKANYRASLMAHIDLWNKQMKDFEDGNAAKDIIEPPNQAVKDTLASLKTLWSDYETLLKANVDSAPVSEDVLLEVSEESVKLNSKADLLVEEYSGYAASIGAQLPPASVVVSRKQRLVLREICTESLFVGLKVNTTVYLEIMADSISLFQTGHTALVRGVDLMGLPQLSEVCTLNKMMHVAEQWNALSAALQVISDNGAATPEDLKTVSAAVVNTDNKMTEAADLYAHVGTPSCPDVASEPTVDMWRAGMSALFMQKSLGELSARLFLQIAIAKPDISTEDLNALGNTLTETSNNLRMVIEGEPTQHIPSPANQAIVDDLMKAWDSFSRMNTVARDEIESREFSALSVQKMESLSNSLLEHLESASAKYLLVEEVANTAALRSDVVSAIYKQLMRVEKMAKEALLTSLGQNAETNKMLVESTTSSFISTHNLLLMGDEATSFPRTTHACTLQKMMAILERFNSLDVLVKSVASGDLRAGSAELLSTVNSIASMTTVARVDISDVSVFYAAGKGNCDTQLTTGVWEEGVTQVVKTPAAFQNAQRNFVLTTSGLADIWAAQAEAALKDHRGYISNDAAEPLLAEAIVAFKASWNSYAGSDEERMEGLQTDYILDNPHPAGAKDALDFAPGPEQYHQDHKKYHPTYRTRLYDRDYYDIFFFDLAGNLIYSVYKELDYATNFAADGGEWKDSGLGEAFRAAMEVPDELHVIDWKPYGPSYGALASFLSKGVFNAAGVLVGVLSTQMPPSAKPIDAPALLIDTINHIDTTLASMKFGDYHADIPPPPTQRVANQLFVVNDKWVPVKALLQQPAESLATVAAILATDADFHNAAEKLIDVYLQDAFANAKNVQGKKVAMVNDQMMLVNRMVKEAVLISMQQESADPAKLKEDIRTFAENHHTLLHGNLANLTIAAGDATDRRLVGHMLTYVDEVPPTTETAAVAIMTDIETGFIGLSEKLLDLANGGDAGEAAMRAIVDDADGVVDLADDAYVYFSTITRSTTTISVDVLSPLPMTGEWAAGRTMRVAALVAQGLINRDQNIMPGYSLNMVFRDDKCESEESVQIVLEEQASNDNYVVLAGSGCSDVCAGTAFVASSMRLPYIAYNCPDAVLSDSSTYAGLTRLGTVTTPMLDAMWEMGKNFGWEYISVISGDPAKYRTYAEKLQKDLTDLGFMTEYVFSYDTQWDETLEMMDLLRVNKRRVFFIIGSETYFRKLICASIVVGANTGITWLSEGSWREDWYKKTDQIVQSHLVWIKGDSQTQLLRDTIKAFKVAWDAYAPTHEERLAGLQAAYIYDNPNPLGAKDVLDYAPGDEAYHMVHKQYHPIYRKTLYERNYYDIFVLDLEGNLMYSVYKELDYATNFAITGTGEWKDSGLGEAFEAGIANPDVVTQIPWKPYGPSYGALASFVAIGIRDEDGNVIGVYSTQFPPDSKSIETVEDDCSLEAITASYEGALNFVGLGQPVAEEMDNPLPCFPGFSASTLATTIDTHFVDGYPIGNDETKVGSVYHDVKMNAADGACVIAYTMKYMMDEGHSIDSIRRPDESLYREFNNYVKTTLSFAGASGPVKFQGNDRPGLLAIQQIVEGSTMLKGTIKNSTAMDLTINGGPSNESWKPEHPDELVQEAEFPYLVFQVLIPILCICAPAVAGCIRSA